MSVTITPHPFDGDMAATLALHHLVLLVLVHSQRLLYILLFFIYRKNIKKNTCNRYFIDFLSIENVTVLSNV